MVITIRFKRTAIFILYFIKIINNSLFSHTFLENLSNRIKFMFMRLRVSNSLFKKKSYYNIFNKILYNRYLSKTNVILEIEYL